MIANVSPSHLSYEDTLNTLKYANRAKNIRVSASQQLIQPDDHVSDQVQIMKCWQITGVTLILERAFIKDNTLMPSQTSVRRSLAASGLGGQEKDTEKERER